MKTEIFNELLSQTLDNRTLTKEQRQENAEVLKSEFKKVKKQRNIVSIASLIVIIVLSILLCKKCETISTRDDKIDSLEKVITDKNQEITEKDQGLLEKDREIASFELLVYFKNQEIDSLKAVVDYYESLKPVNLVTKITKTSESKEIVIVDAVMRPKSSKYKSRVIFEYDLCDSIKAENERLRMERDFESDTREVAMDSLNNVLNTPVEIALVKSTPNDTSVVASKEMEYYKMIHNALGNNPEPFVSDRPFHEYTSMADYYRAKSEICGWTGLGLGVLSAGFYGMSEAMGHPIFRDLPADNSAAQQKSNTIKGLRITSAVFGAASAVQLIRAWHYHRLEGKFIIYPTEYGAAAGVSVKIPEIK